MDVGSAIYSVNHMCECVHDIVWTCSVSVGISVSVCMSVNVSGKTANQVKHRGKGEVVIVKGNSAVINLFRLVSQ